MDQKSKEAKINELSEKLTLYQEKLQKLMFEEDKAAGARYGNEFLQNRVKVYEDIIRTTKIEILRLKQLKP